MTRLTLTCCLLIVGCGGTIELSSGDAGTDGTRGGGTTTAPPPEQQLSTSLPSWCTQICAKMVQCQTPGTDSTCATECNTATSNWFSGHGNACAQLGLDFMNCLNNSTCSDLSNGSTACNPNTTAAQVACGTGDVDASVSVNDSGAPPYTLVTCQSGSGMGIAGGSIPIGATVCQSNANNCTDGYSYSIDCVYAGNNQSTCTCYRDGVMGVTFSTSGTSCPNVTLTNAYCGWQLASL